MQTATRPSTWRALGQLLGRQRMPDFHGTEITRKAFGKLEQARGITSWHLGLEGREYGLENEGMVGKRSCVAATQDNFVEASANLVESTWSMKASPSRRESQLTTDFKRASLSRQMSTINRIRPTPAPPTASTLPGVKKVVLIASGKGGVGKSTLAGSGHALVNIAIITYCVRILLDSFIRA